MQDELIELVKQYCASRNLLVESYMEGLALGGPLDSVTQSTLIRYHKEWLSGKRM